MKSLLSLLLFFITVVLYSQVGIGTTSPSEASMLEISGVTTGGIYKGMLPPRVATTANQLSISPTAADIGLMVFVEETSCLDFWNGTNWENIYCTGGPAEVWVNEFHYFDNAGDTSQFIEIAGPSGTDVSGYYIVRYNGANGRPYAAVLPFTGVIGNEENGFGTLSTGANNLQNAIDGFALVGPDGKVVQFLSYEGSFVGVGGPANGLTSIDVGFMENAATTQNQSIHLTGTGNSFIDFTWSNSADGQATEGSKNNGQTFN